MYVCTLQMMSRARAPRRRSPTLASGSFDRSTDRPIAVVVFAVSLSPSAVRRSSAASATRANPIGARDAKRRARSFARAADDRATSLARLATRKRRARSSSRRPPPRPRTRASAARRQCAASRRIESNRIERTNESSCRARSRLARRVSRARPRRHRARRSRTSSRCRDDARRRREEARTGRPSNGT